LGAGLGEVRRLSVVVRFLLGSRDHADLAAQAAVVPPVEVLEDRELELVDGAPRPAAVDQFGLDLPGRRFG